MIKEFIIPSTGKMFPYFLGMGKRAKEMYSFDDVVFSASSFGIFIAVVMLADEIDEREIIKDLISMTKYPLNKFFWKQMMRELCDKYISDDVYCKIQGNLICKGTKLNSFMLPESVIVSNWDSKEDFIDCICALCHIPLICDNKICEKYKGTKLMDGRFSNCSNLRVTGYDTVKFKQIEWVTLKEFMVSFDEENINKMFTDGIREFINLNIDEITENSERSENTLNNNIMKEDAEIY